MAWIAPISYCWLHGMGNESCRSRQQVKKIYEGWARYVSKFGYRGYNYNFGDCALPFSKMSVWRHDIPFLADKGCIGISMETLPCWMSYGPHIYLFLRLAYDPSADADRLTQDYFQKFYGPEAGPLVREYFKRVDRAVQELPCDPERGGRGLDQLGRIYAPELLERLRTLLDKAAAAAAPHPRPMARVAMTAQGLRNAEQYARIRSAMDRGDYSQAKEVYDDFIYRNEHLVRTGLTNHYTVQYVHRFLARGRELIYRAAISPPNSVLRELPDMWKHHWDKDGTGTDKGYHRVDFDDSGWETISTYEQKMTSSGELASTRQWQYRWFRTTFELPEEHGPIGLFFSRLHPGCHIYVNGQMVNGPEDRPRRQWGVSFVADVTEAVRPGENVLAVRRPHAWGRLVEKPVIVIEKGE
jgi:hypothetical protein